ncbi:CYFA0S16e00155g1_1 [Cyberlindnera fabianii]|uniref:CYFA0S16e00155g1_1 n=1 Tax=Cyberlindnera fabianii TaxID=36022 RepID=A0A061BAL0_CYBFA|nr:CYFA0S16e00155g1_1 [Cyberlindnera fabianii]
MSLYGLVTENPTPESITNILQEISSLFDTSIDLAVKSTDLETELYTLDPEDPSARDRYKQLLAELKEQLVPLSKESAKLDELEKKLHQSHRLAIKELKDLNLTSFEQTNKTAEFLFDEDMRSAEIEKLVDEQGVLKPIELDEGEVIDMTLSKDEMMKILTLESNKRGMATLKNEYLLLPKMQALKAKYEALARQEKELKEFLFDGVSSMNTKVQATKRTLQ